ncbi:hypothetical protein GN244_ATG09308 [Phytophthora infestans]|uniref:RxLR effector protein n=1 Tax=Phytophthora infestans TaxID=4787 RepID=A0A833STL8_PHYIN|nr:hypothetical protein GN244_ATG09308 [Phytophthora infestans]
MRSMFYVVLAAALFTRTTVVTAFTTADESQLVSKMSPDFASDVKISGDFQTRSLRVTDPEDGNLMIDSEERTKYGSLKDVIKRSTAADILKDMPSDSVRKMVKAVKYNSELTKKEEEVVNALLALAAKA